MVPWEVEVEVEVDVEGFAIGYTITKEIAGIEDVLQRLDCAARPQYFCPPGLDGLTISMDLSAATLLLP